MVSTACAAAVLALLVPSVLGTGSAAGDASLSLLQVQAAFVHDSSPAASRRAAAAAVIEQDIKNDETKELFALSKVPERMKYWNRWKTIQGRPSLPRQSKSYLLFDADIGGLNNIRLGWEAAGIIANVTGRTLVLPPASRFYLIDYGAEGFIVPGREQGHSFSKVEDFISLPQLRRHTRTLTFKEFLVEASVELGLAVPEWLQNVPEDPSISRDTVSTQELLMAQWGHFIENQTKLTKTVNSTTCDISLYGTDHPIAYSHMVWDDEGLTREDSRLFVCMYAPADQNKETWQMSPNAVELQRGSFVWHPEVFQLAAPIIADLGLFQYTSIHARYGDLQYNAMKQQPDALVERWFTSDEGQLLSPGVNRSKPRPHDSKGAVYISTDGGRDVIRAFRQRGIRAKWSEDYFNSTSSPIFHLLKKKDSYRIHQLKGPVEQIICAFARTFIGTGKSTFTNYINQVRFDADAPVTQDLYHTQHLTTDVLNRVLEEIRPWEERGGRQQWAPAPPVEATLQQLAREKLELELPVERLMLLGARLPDAL